MNTRKKKKKEKKEKIKVDKKDIDSTNPLTKEIDNEKKEDETEVKKEDTEVKKDEEKTNLKAEIEKDLASKPKFEAPGKKKRT